VDWVESSYSERTTVRLARAGALVQVVCADDACDVCKALAGRTYSPSEVPRLPIRGCRNERCRCRFEAVDPESKLTASQLVDRGIQAIKAGRGDIAEKILRRAVALDEMHELGWLWLSAVVEDENKIACLEKALAINPHNRRAQAGLDVLRRKLGTAQPAPAPPPAPPPTAPAPEPPPALPLIAPAPEQEPGLADAVEPAPQEIEAESVEVPPELEIIRAERRVIAEQWAEFIAFAVEIDPHMVLMQGQAFLQKLKRLNQQANEMLTSSGASDGSTPALVRDELYLQWQESESIGEALAGIIEGHQARDHDAPNWQLMQDMLRDLAQDVLEHRDGLRTQITEAGGQVPG
jgi:hypothetical protein